MAAIKKEIKKWSYEYIYIFVMIIYMARLTPETSRMTTGGLVNNLVGFFIPIILTFILIRKNKISLKNKRLIILLSITLLWSILITIKYNAFNRSNFSYMFFVFYPIIMAFIHVKVYGKKLFILYEDIFVLLCKIDLVLWFLCVIFNGPARSFFSLFPQVTFGPHFLYIFHFMDGYQYTYGIMRNSGFSWEPGRFAIMVCLAILINLLRNGVKFRKNRNMWILLFSLATTMSTTGYATVIILYTLFYIKSYNFKNIFILLFIILPITIGLMQLDFMSKKIGERVKIEELNDKLQYSAIQHAKMGDTEHLVSLDRFQSIFWEYQNFLSDPLLGYSNDLNNSFFRKNITEVYTLTGGLMKVISQFGIFLGCYFYFCLFKSSIRISNEFEHKHSFAIFILILLSSISYPIFANPIYMAIWFYGVFEKENKERSSLRRL